MGGLVARSACHAGGDGDDWVGTSARRLARLAAHGRAARAGRPLRRAPGSRRCPRRACSARFLRRRSAGIRDLRQGSLVDEDWRDRDPEALRAAACQEVPLLEGATHCFVSATVTRSPRHPLGRLVGDTLVLGAERVGPRRARRKLGFEDEYGLHVGATHHIALLNHPAVYEKLQAWLALADYPHVLDIPTRWKDNDVYGHVNNVEYYSYFDTVINRWLITEGGLDIHAGAVIGLCVESHCAFKAAMAFPDSCAPGCASRTSAARASATRSGCSARTTASRPRRAGSCTSSSTAPTAGRATSRSACARRWSGCVVGARPGAA